MNSGKRVISLMNFACFDGSFSKHFLKQNNSHFFSMHSIWKQAQKHIWKRFHY